MFCAFRSDVKSLDGICRKCRDSREFIAHGAYVVGIRQDFQGFLNCVQFMLADQHADVAVSGCEFDSPALPYNQIMQLNQIRVSTTGCEFQAKKMILSKIVHTFEYVFGAKRFADSQENQISVTRLTPVAAELAQIGALIGPEQGNYFYCVNRREFDRYL
jgi:hypothetical protein